MAAEIRAMNTPTPSSDPLKPAYPPDPVEGAQAKPRVALGRRRNVVGLILLITILLALFVVFGRKNGAPPSPPPATEIEPAD
jgi:hypothetical protein